MKKTLLASLGIVLLAYPAASWYLGVRVESVLDAHYRQLESMAYVTVSERHYERGVFGATESVTLELFAELMKQLDDGTSPRTPLQITLRSRIRHGPFAGGRLAVATMRGELLLDPEIQAEVDRLTGGRACSAAGPSSSSTAAAPGSSAARPSPRPLPTRTRARRSVWSGGAFAARWRSRRRCSATA